MAPSPSEPLEPTARRTSSVSLAPPPRLRQFLRQRSLVAFTLLFIAGFASTWGPGAWVRLPRPGFGGAEFDRSCAGPHLGALPSQASWKGYVARYRFQLVRSSAAWRLNRSLICHSSPFLFLCPFLLPLSPSLSLRFWNWIIAFCVPYITDEGQGNLGSKIAFIWVSLDKACSRSPFSSLTSLTPLIQFGTSLIAAIWTYLFVPETRHWSLEQLGAFPP